MMNLYSPPFDKLAHGAIAAAIGIPAALLGYAWSGFLINLAWTYAREQAQEERVMARSPLSFIPLYWRRDSQRDLVVNVAWSMLIVLVFGG